MAEWILELDRGEGVPWKGNYSSLAGAEAEAAGAGGEDREPRGRSRSSASWSGCDSSPKARQAKGKARSAALRGDARRRSQEKREATGEIYHPARAEAGRRWWSRRRACRRRSATGCSIDDLTFKLPPGGIVGVIGPNGAGKTTLFRMITGKEKPDAGELKIGETVKLAYVDQSRDALDGEKIGVRGGLAAGWTRSTSGGAADASRARTWRASRSRARTSRSG